MKKAKTVSSVFRVALLQIECGLADKQANFALAEAAVKAACEEHHADIVVLPECWNSPYDVKQFKRYAEAIPSGPTTQLLKSWGRKWGKIIVGGSWPELTLQNQVFNTCVVVDGSGDIVGKHRKAHLFDIDVPGGITFKESETLTPGNNATVIKVDEQLTLGIGICYDIRFPHYASTLAAEGANVLVYPAAFNMTTGPPHWELLYRSTGLNTQSFVLACSPARNEQAGYVAYGHSMVVSPWGEVLAAAEAAPQIVVADIDLKRVEEVRASIPTSTQQRNDLYKVKQ